MTLTDAQNLASIHGLLASQEECGFCHLRFPGGALAARGQTFEDCFERWQEQQPQTPLVPTEPQPGHLF